METGKCRTSCIPNIMTNIIPRNYVTFTEVSSDKSEIFKCVEYSISFLKHVRTENWTVHIAEGLRREFIA